MIKVYKMLVDDSPGVLDRIAGLVRRHSMNINYLLVVPAEHEGKSIMTVKIKSKAGDAALEERLHSLECVHSLEFELEAAENGEES